MNRETEMERPLTGSFENQYAKEAGVFSSLNREPASWGELCPAMAIGICPWPRTLLALESARAPGPQRLMEDREASMESQDPAGHWGVMSHGDKGNWHSLCFWKDE